MNWTNIGRRIVFTVCCVAALPAVSLGCPQGATQERAEFDAFFDTVTKAEAELFRGRPESLKALWSRASEVTLFGVSGGTLTVERIASYVEGNLGYVVQREKVRFKLPGHTEESILEIRATWIFRRERDGWRIIHRHADSQMKRQGPAERKN